MTSYLALKTNPSRRVIRLDPPGTSPILKMTGITFDFLTLSPGKKDWERSPRGGEFERIKIVPQSETVHEVAWMIFFPFVLR